MIGPLPRNHKHCRDCGWDLVHSYCLNPTKRCEKKGPTGRNFCEFCGKPVHGNPVCPHCGKKATFPRH